MKTISKAELARRLRVSPPRITQATYPGKPLHHAMDTAGNIVLDSQACLEFLGKRELDQQTMLAWGITESMLAKYRPVDGQLIPLPSEPKAKPIRKPKPKKQKPAKPIPAPATAMVSAVRENAANSQITNEEQQMPATAEIQPVQEHKPARKPHEEYIPNSDIDEDVSTYLDLTVREVIEKFGTDSNFKNVLDARKSIEDIKRKEFDNRMKAGEFIPRETVKKHIFPFIDNAFIRLVEDLPGTLARQIKAKALAEASDEELTEFAREKISLTLKGLKDSAIKRLADV